jgi:hypothetical protein
MDPLKSFMSFQQDFMSKMIPKEFAAPFQELLSSMNNMDPGVMLEKVKDAVAQLVKVSPLKSYTDFLKELNSKSGDFIKMFQENMGNPMMLFNGFFKK